MWENTIELLKKKGVIVDKGLSDAEIGQIEQLYKIRVPQILQDLWKEGLPISKSFYNWRDFTPRNIGKIKSAMDKPFNDIRELAGEADWNGDWGEMPASSGDIADFIRKKADAAPRLIPIYGHRYMPAAAVENPPVFSICGLDVIIYGSDLEAYFQQPRS